ncbi:demethoxyubiquinone hydroxylase family protein [Luteimonas sp. SJ-92]|uniref:Demethoxyubiquinone hydroxylase family protein n=1 Tax=Luteimonas salinisoli TaxID=2752307 RepID=A0A853JGD6_9GAMM|nr:demethoxyubiquinone hydroxylase family protein [Luteimonas salinisoli]
MIKINHAGEHGAICIYTGQILMARLTARGMIGELTEFRSHERRHRDIFRAELQRRRQRRCRSYWLCGLGGFVLGATTGLLGPSAIAATTAAVESVVLRHLQQQLVALRDSDSAAASAISSIVAEEQQHHDRSASQVQAGRFWPKVLVPMVSAATESVIWLGMRA